MTKFVYNENYYDSLDDLADHFVTSNSSLIQADFDEHEFKQEMLKELYTTKPMSVPNLFSNFWEDLHESLELHEDCKDVKSYVDQDVVVMLESCFDEIRKTIEKTFVVEDKRVSEDVVDELILLIKEEFSQQ